MRIIDIHVYCGYFPYPILTRSIDDILRIMDINGIEKAILISAKALQFDPVEGNAEIMKFIKNQPRLYGYVVVNPSYPELSVQEIKKYLGNKKFVGVKYHPELSTVPLIEVSDAPFFDILEEYGKPLLVHTWHKAEHGGAAPSSTPDIVAEFAKRRPNLKVIMGHMGGTAWKSAVDKAKPLQNVFLDICASFADNDKIGYAVNQIGSERILFGSGMSENNAAMQIGAVLEAKISEMDRQLIFYKNAMRLFNIE